MSTDAPASVPAPQHPSVAFRLLGAVQMIVDGQPQPVGPEQEQRMLVKLLAAKGAPVSHEEMMDAVWDEPSGRGASLDALYHLASAIRGRLRPVGLDVVSAQSAYQLQVDSMAVDVHAFRTLTKDARKLACARDQRAVGLFEEALRLHHGEPLTGLRGQWIGGYRYTLTGELFAAQVSLYEAAIRHGESSERLPGLLSLRQRQPESERAVWLLMHALYRAGHQAEALRVKRDFGEHMVETNGQRTSKALNDLYDRILKEEDNLLTWEAVSFPTEETGSRGRQRAQPGPDAAPDAIAPESSPSPPAETDPPGDSPENGLLRDTASSSFNFHGTVYAPGSHFGPRITHPRVS